MGSSQSTDAAAVSSPTATTPTPAPSSSAATPPPAASQHQQTESPGLGNKTIATKTIGGYGTGAAVPEGKSRSEAVAEKMRFDPKKDLPQDAGHLSEVLSKYKIASPEAEKYFYETQPANQAAKGGSSAGRSGAMATSGAIGADAAAATAKAKEVVEEARRQGAKVGMIDNSMSKEEIIQLLSQTEGLDISKKRKQELSQQWRFMLASDPIQYGFDAGLLTGCIASGLSILKPVNRNPVRVGTFFCGGFSVGMMLFPLACVAWEEYNFNRSTRAEQARYADQRKEFHEKGGVTPPALP